MTEPPSSWNVPQLLQCRLEHGQAEAPPPPRVAAWLEEVERPWWLARPRRFRELAQRLQSWHVAYGHAMETGSRDSHPVPVLLVEAEETVPAHARVLYVAVRGGRLHLRFQLDPPRPLPASEWEVTLLGADGAPLVEVPAPASLENEYSIEAPLPEALAAAWDGLRVVDRMPFRLLLRAPGS